MAITVKDHTHKVNSDTRNPKKCFTFTVCSNFIKNNTK